ncbi:hemerythrin domain-containing protein [Halopseudomonas pertucinogena]|uniref:Hemerythrin-like domain-containing protein n=1 Tax=Halopseudomonas pertucinogena TaxID=86175 RepID=A0ABQ2CK56_9GAMM|nr:hemerythrin domain-containing protein [Halopseudomonas pertucinogena]GGI91910.1 hypothetical protein GCM10009083_05510 [Halopseudomonas pertucinogena]
MNAIELLKQDHEKVKKLLEDISNTTERAFKKRAELLQKIALELQAHTTIEEEIFYPAFREAGERDELKMYHEAKEEHRAVEALVLPDLLATDPGTVEFSGRVKVLKELLEHHIEEEEEEMFTQARELLSEEELTTLGKAMKEKKMEVMKAAA